MKEAVSFNPEAAFRPTPIFERIAQTAPVPETERKAALLSKYWFDTVLGTSAPQENPILQAGDEMKRRDALHQTLHSRLMQLPGELGMLTFPGQVGEASILQIDQFANAFTAPESKLLNPEEKRQIKEFVGFIRGMDKPDVSPQEKEGVRQAKESLYMNLMRAQLGSLHPQVFSFFPGQSAKNKTIDCSLGVALGKVLADQAGIESEIVSVPGHVLLAVKRGEKTYTAYDMVNRHMKPIALKEGPDFHGRKMLRKSADEGDIQSPYRIFISEPMESIVNTIIGNTEYYLNYPSEYEEELKRSAHQLEDKVVMESIKREYPQGFFTQVRNELYGEVPAYLTSKEWSEEKERVAKWLKKPPSQAEPTQKEALPKTLDVKQPIHPETVAPPKPESGLKKLWKGIKEAIKKVLRWIAS